MRTISNILCSKCVWVAIIGQLLGLFICIVYPCDIDSVVMAEATPAVLQNVPFPSKLDTTRGNIAHNWKRFKRSWENYELASRLDKQTADVRAANLISCLGEDAMEIMDGLTFDAPADKKDPEKNILAFTNFCIGESNETFERYCFFTRDQNESETIDSYTAGLRLLAKTCNFAALEDNLIRDRIVVGIRDASTRKRLLSQENLDLKKTMQLCRASETTEKYSKAIVHAAESDSVHKVSSYKN